MLILYVAGGSSAGKASSTAGKAGFTKVCISALCFEKNWTPVKSSGVQSTCTCTSQCLPTCMSWAQVDILHIESGGNLRHGSDTGADKHDQLWVCVG